MVVVAGVVDDDDDDDALGAFIPRTEHPAIAAREPNTNQRQRALTMFAISRSVSSRRSKPCIGPSIVVTGGERAG